MKNKKKKLIVSVIIALIIILILKIVLGFVNFYKPIYSVDYSKYEFAGHSWKGEGGDLYLGEDGEFYFGFDGESEGEYDLCSNYTYNDLNKTISLKCLPYFLGAKRIKLLEVNDHFIKIRFRNKTSVYVKEFEYECKYEYKEGCESEEECDYDYAKGCKYDEKFINSWESVDKNGKYFLGLEETGMINYFYINKIDAKEYDPENILDDEYDEYDEYDEDGPETSFIDFYGEKKSNKRVCNGNKYDSYVVNYTSKYYEFSCDINNWKNRRYRFYYDESDNSINVVKGKEIEKLYIELVTEETLKIKIDGKVMEFTPEED